MSGTAHSESLVEPPSPVGDVISVGDSTSGSGVIPGPAAPGLTRIVEPELLSTSVWPTQLCSFTTCELEAGDPEGSSCGVPELGLEETPIGAVYGLPSEHQQIMKDSMGRVNEESMRPARGLRGLHPL